ncbi:MAG: Flp pilus assembly complex ATPase component TadA [Desulfobacteraceae bacterium]|nr:Flp pilus assembly complex ATPase component TadA [Desulfobacteraceae bacterium]
MRKKKRLGEMLIEEGLINEKQLQTALQEQKAAGQKLGEFLVHRNICREDAIVDMLSRQLRIDKYDPSSYPLDLGLAEIIDAETAKNKKVVPVEKLGGVLRVATTDPLDIDTLDSLEVITNLEIEPIVCTQADFEQAYNSLYGLYRGMDDIMKSVDEDITAVRGEQEEAGAAGLGGDQDIHVLESQADQAPVIRMVNSIIAQAVNQKASDVHISPEKNRVQVRFRVDGRLREVPAPPKKLMPALASRIKILANMDISVTRIPQDGRFTVTMNNREINVRASCIPTIYGENIVLRLLDMSADIFTLDDLGMNADDQQKMEDAIVKPCGMILSTGPTGSGKSTSLYAILRRINRQDINIITLEDPVEYRVGGIRQVQLNTRAGMTFASGLRSILRQDPDVLMVGEMRDAETARIGVQAAMTGHRVLSTVHTNDAAGAIARLVDMGIEPFLIASTLLVSFAQRLLRRVCTHCAEPYTPSDKGLQSLGLERATGCRFLQGKGCQMCMNTGYRGRTAVFEVVRVDDEVADLIMNRASASQINRALIESGKLKTLREDAAQKVCRGETTVEEAVSVVMV